jgi:hypothetical protein
MPFAAGAPDASFLEGDSRSSKKSATIGYSVADLLSDHQRSNSCDRMNNTSPERSGNFIFYKTSQKFYLNANNKNAFQTTMQKVNWISCRKAVAA